MAWQVRYVWVYHVVLRYGAAGKVGYVVVRWGRVGYGQAGEVGSVLVDQVGCGSAGLVRLDWVRSGLVT